MTQPSKTLGPESARLVSILNEEQRTLFGVNDVMRVLSISRQNAINFVGNLIHRGLVTRLRPGLYNLVPFELGRETTYVSDPYLIARAVIEHKTRSKSQLKTPIYYLSHASAMEIHQMLTQPQLGVLVSTPLAIPHQWMHGIEFRFVRCKKTHLFGITTHWANKTEKVWVSDIERTVLDGLKQPEYCGGITEVAKGLWMQKHQIDPEKLIAYALKLKVGAVFRRLGFLLETYKMANESQVEVLLKKMTNTYVLLDPGLLEEGKYLARWRIRLNVIPEELKAATRT